jgi:chemotaxis signal transduction protein
MLTNGNNSLARAVAMRREFDLAFAGPIERDETAREKFLAIYIGGRPCAVKLSAIAGLYAGKKITPVPGSHAALRGIAGFRGAVLPVYDLPRLLGVPAAGDLRWLVIAKAAPTALAFERFDAQLIAPPTAILTQVARSDLANFAREFLHLPDFSGPILHLPSVLDAIGISQHGTAA